MYFNINMRNFNLSSFQNICRVCMSEDNLETLQDGHRKTLNLISKVQYSKNDELPQKICANCVRRVNDVMSLALICKRIDQTLKKYLENLKLENMELKLPDPLKQEEITIVEEKIEFIDVNEQIDVETNYVKKELEKIKEQLIQAELNQTTPYPPPKPRPFQCKYCNRRFPLRSTQLAHMRNVHSHATAHRCDICGQYFRLKSEWDKHRLKHKPVFCKRCKQSFMSEENLKMHQQLHEKEKPYECLICFKTFYFLQSYLKHNTIHGPDERFKCDECDEILSSESSLARHKRSHKRAKRCTK